jgi:hypothetical protein
MIALRRRMEEELARRSAGAIWSGPVRRQALAIEPRPSPTAARNQQATRRP